MVKRILFHRMSMVISVLMVGAIIFANILPSLAAPTFTEYVTPGTNSMPRTMVNGPDGNIWYVDHGDWLSWGHPGPYSIGKLNPANGSITTYALPD